MYVTDGDVSLSQSCEVCFTSAEHLLCDIHMYDNISKKLQSLNIPKEVCKTVLINSFGISRESTKEPGLVDSEPGLVDSLTDEEFDDK